MTKAQPTSSVAPLDPAFRQTYGAGVAQVIWRKHVSDMETPVSAYLKIAGDRPNTFLLESVEGGETLGRYSIIGIRPDVIWRASGDTVEINRHADQLNCAFEPDDQPMLTSLQTLLDESRIDLPEEIAAKLPPMFAGVFGYFGYDTVNHVEKLPRNTDNGLNLQDSIFIRPTVLAVFDNIRHEIIFITPVRPRDGVSADDAFLAANARITDAISSLTTPKALPGAEVESDTEVEFKSNMTDAEFGHMVNTGKEYIRAGDIFQVVLSQRFSAPYNADPFSLYRALRRLNPSPFLFFLNFDDCALVGSSPEILVRVRDNEVTIRPLAGTRRRGATNAEDLALEEELLADPKERAEHLMLLDLGRNDVGRSAKLGSVKVTDQFTVERYSHVMHIVSNVVGDLDDGKTAIEALMAGFPAGTLSGAPKIRAMEIIAELEKDRRGPYGGCIGYFSADGNLDTCIAFRMAIIKDGKMHVQAGAGIVADSDPAAEYQECINKASALFRAASLVKQN